MNSVSIAKVRICSQSHWMSRGSTIEFRCKLLICKYVNTSHTLNPGSMDGYSSKSVRHDG